MGLGVDPAGSPPPVLRPVRSQNGTRCASGPVHRVHLAQDGRTGHEVLKLPRDARHRIGDALQATAVVAPDQLRAIRTVCRLTSRPDPSFSVSCTSRSGERRRSSTRRWAAGCRWRGRRSSRASGRSGRQGGGDRGETPARSPTLPDVPTIAEAGYPDAEFNFWVGLPRAGKTPGAEIVNRPQRRSRQGAQATRGADPFCQPRRGADVHDGRAVRRVPRAEARHPRQGMREAGVPSH